MFANSAVSQLYIGERNKRANETDFLHALELLLIAYEVSTAAVDTVARPLPPSIAPGYYFVLLVHFVCRIRRVKGSLN